MKSSDVESHDASGVGERYQAYLRRIYNKATELAVTLPNKLSPALSVKAAKDTAIPFGPVPLLLVFGNMRRISVHPKDLLGRVERRNALTADRKDMLAVATK